MKQEPQNDHDDLDKMLARAPMPKAPAWFEARLIARLRREQARELSWWSKVKRHSVLWGVCTVTAAIVVVSGACLLLGSKYASLLNSPSVAANANDETNAAQLRRAGGLRLPGKSSSNNEKVSAALDAFKSYQEDNSLWSDSQ